MDGWPDPDWLTLQLAPFWVMSALTGRDHFDELEQQAFVRAVEAAPSGDCSLPWQLMQAVSRNSEWLFGQFMLDDRSIVTGLNEVTILL